MLKDSGSISFALLLALAGACTEDVHDSGAGPARSLGGKADTVGCPEEVAQIFDECVSESWSEVPLAGGIIDAVEYCMADEDSLDITFSNLCEDGEGCDFTKAELIEELAPGCRRELTPIFGVYLDLRDEGEGADPEASRFLLWQESEDGGLYYSSSEFLTEPDFSESTGDFTVSFDAEGRVSLDYSYGDADATAASSMKLPADVGGITAGAGLYELSVRGGDHASGAWGAQGTLTLEIAR